MKVVHRIIPIYLFIEVFVAFLLYFIMGYDGEPFEHFLSIIVLICSVISLIAAYLMSNSNKNFFEITNLIMTLGIAGSIAAAVRFWYGYLIYVNMNLSFQNIASGITSTIILVDLSLAFIYFIFMAITLKNPKMYYLNLGFLATILSVVILQAVLFIIRDAGEFNFTVWSKVIVNFSFVLALITIYIRYITSYKKDILRETKEIHEISLDL